jgi:hypothetical protein
MSPTIYGRILERNVGTRRRAEKRPGEIAEAYGTLSHSKRDADPMGTVFPVLNVVFFQSFQGSPCWKTREILFGGGSYEVTKAQDEWRGVSGKSD